MAQDSMLIQIRERDFADLLDLAMVVIRERPKPIGWAAAAGVLPFMSVNYLLLSTPDFPQLLVFPLIALEIPWAMAPLTVVLGLLMFGEKLSVRKVSRQILGRLPALFLTQFVFRLTCMLTLILFIFFPTRYVFLNEVILLERGKLRSLSRRCGILSGNSQGDYLGQLFGQIFFGTLFVLSFWFGSSAVISALSTPELDWERPEFADLTHIVIQLAIWITLVFFTVGRFLMYIDRRIRLEGWEVKLRLQSVGQALEREGRW